MSTHRGRRCGILAQTKGAGGTLTTGTYRTHRQGACGERTANTKRNTIRSLARNNRCIRWSCPRIARCTRNGCHAVGEHRTRTYVRACTRYGARCARNIIDGQCASCALSKTINAANTQGTARSKIRCKRHRHCLCSLTRHNRGVGGCGPSIACRCRYCSAGIGLRATRAYIG